MRVLKPGLEEFYFQVTLMSNGTIIFCYQDIPDGSISEIISSDIDIIHPVKIGLWDSFVYEAKNVMTNKTSAILYKYHTLDPTPKAKGITSHTAILLEPLPTCNTFSSCSSCLSSDPQYRCAWCPACSSVLMGWTEDDRSGTTGGASSQILGSGLWTSALHSLSGSGRNTTHRLCIIRQSHYLDIIHKDIRTFLNLRI